MKPIEYLPYNIRQCVKIILWRPKLVVKLKYLQKFTGNLQFVEIR
jgi:hypothetical protein